MQASLLQVLEESTDLSRLSWLGVDGFFFRSNTEFFSIIHRIFFDHTPTFFSNDRKI